MHTRQLTLISGAVLAALLVMAGSISEATTKLTPSDIQAQFFNGQPFTSATPSNIKFKVLFTPDGKMAREPVGTAGVKGTGTWALSKEGFCTTWKGSKANCFTLVSAGDNKWSVMKGSALVGTWAK